MKSLSFVVAVSICSFASADPISLTDKQLDHVSAGQVRLTLNAESIAVGPEAEAIALTNVDVRQNGNGRATVGRGQAIAYGSGDSVSTDVSYALATDEEVKMLNARETYNQGSVKSNGRGSGQYRLRGNGNNRNNIQPVGYTTELRTLQVRVVTVRKR